MCELVCVLCVDDMWVDCCVWCKCDLGVVVELVGCCCGCVWCVVVVGCECL